MKERQRFTYVNDLILLILSRCSSGLTAKDIHLHFNKFTKGLEDGQIKMSSLYEHLRRLEKARLVCYVYQQNRLVKYYFLSEEGKDTVSLIKKSCKDLL